MKVKKRVLCPERLRRVPAQFSWIDQQLVRQPGYLQRCDLGALALYLILVTVGDAEGLSYYSDESLQRLLRIERAQFLQARHQLSEAGLIVYEHPLYQVLCLQPTVAQAAAPRAEQSRSAKEILQHILRGQP